MSQPKSEARTGATLIELMLVLAIVGVLSGLLLAGVQQVRAAADRASCKNNMKQLGMAIQNFESSRGEFPQSGRLGITFVQWRTLLLPYLERDDLWRSAEAACGAEFRSWLSPPHTCVNAMVPTFACPSDWRLSAVHAVREGINMAFGSYLGVNGSLHSAGIFCGRRVRTADVQDGLSQTLMLGERPPPDTWRAGWWYSDLIDHAALGNRQLGPNSSTALGPLLPPAVLLEGAVAVLEEFLLPEVEGVDADPQLVPDLRDGHFVDQVPLDGGDSLFRRAMRSVRLGHGKNLPRVFLTRPEAKVHFRLEQDNSLGVL